MFHIALVEDDEACALETQTYIENFGKESGLELRVTRFSSGVRFLDGYSPIYDIVFMDIEMPEMNGMDTARKLREIDPVVVLIFVTNMAQYAIKGYEVNAIDYMVKPVGYFNFKLKLQKAIKYAGLQTGVNISVQQSGGSARIKSSDVRYVEVVDHKLIFHTDVRDYEMRGSLSVIEEQLCDSGFARCNHCYLINMRYITGINGSFVKLSSGENLQISRPKRKAFLDKLAGYSIGGRS